MYSSYKTFSNLDSHDEHFLLLSLKNICLNLTYNIQYRNTEYFIHMNMGTGFVIVDNSIYLYLPFHLIFAYTISYNTQYTH